MNRDEGINDRDDGATPLETPESITHWGVTTFGPNPALVLALRMNVEMAELLAELMNSYPKLEKGPLGQLLTANEWLANSMNALSSTVPRAGTEVNEEARWECADVGIMLDQVSHLLGGRPAEDKTEKMRLNRQRRWARDAHGKMQHVDTFRDPSTGIEMSPDLWYIVSDSGSAYTSEGFDCVSEATDWMRQHAEEYGIDLKAVHVPVFLGADRGWADLDATNVLLGANVRDFFRATDPEGWAFMNPQPTEGAAA